MHAKRFPGEDATYRAARNTLLAAERELRARVEQVAALRRALPAGGAVPEDYRFEIGGEDLADAETVRTVRLSELFGRFDTLVVYSFMYGPKAAEACPMCTAMLDSLNGAVEHAGQQTGVVVVAKSPIGRIRDYARRRGWGKLRLASSQGNTYNRDYFAESEQGDQLPMLNVFVRRGAAVRHFWGSELFFVGGEPGQHPRHVDAIWPLWNLLDLTPEGRGAGWMPKRAYA